MVAEPQSTATTWRYKAEFPDGRVIDGEVVAADENAAAREVRALGATPVRLSKGASPGQLFARRRELKPGEATSLARSLADLLTAGVPLRSALGSLAERERRPVLKATLERLDQRVRAGETFSSALRVDPSRPPAVMLAMAEAGEASGQLGKVFCELADRMEDEQAVRQDIAGQMTYPMFIAVIMGAALLGLAHFVLPQFETLFQDQRVPPPAETRFVLEVGAFLRAWGHWLPVGAIILTIVLKGLAKPFAFEIERALVSIPTCGPLFMRLQAARYARTLGQLMDAGYALARAEPVARGVLTSQVARRRLTASADEVRAGGRFADAVRRHDALPDDFIRFIQLGEQTGRLSDMLIRAADLAETESTRTIKRISELISPIMIVILALCVMTVIVFILIGVLSLNEVVYT